MSDPVTVIVRRRVRADAQDEFERWQAKINAASTRFPGNLGLQVIRPEDPRTQDYVIIFRFDTEEHLMDWERSEERARLIAEAESFTETISIEKITGLEYWFSVPGHAAMRPPPATKMALVTLIGIYPLAQWVAPAIARPLHRALPAELVGLITSSALVILMTWVVMPALTRLFRRWLFD